MLTHQRKPYVYTILKVAFHLSQKSQNGGTCVDGINTASCNCMQGFTGPRCETNIGKSFSSHISMLKSITVIVIGYWYRLILWPLKSRSPEMSAFGAK